MVQHVGLDTDPKKNTLGLYFIQGHFNRTTRAVEQQVTTRGIGGGSSFGGGDGADSEQRERRVVGDSDRSRGDPAGRSAAVGMRIAAHVMSRLLLDIDPEIPSGI